MLKSHTWWISWSTAVVTFSCSFLVTVSCLTAWRVDCQWMCPEGHVTSTTYRGDGLVDGGVVVTGLGHEALNCLLGLIHCDVVGVV